MQELFLQSCETELMHYAKKHVVDYCCACGVAHVVVQCALDREYLQEKGVGAVRWERDNTTTSAKQTNDDTLKVMNNR